MSRFPDTAVVSLPAGAKTLIAEVAQRRSMLPAQYMRTAVIEKLKADGADPTTTTTQAVAQ